MPGQSPPSDDRSPSPESVRRSLRALADGSAGVESDDRSDRDGHRSVRPKRAASDEDARGAEAFERAVSGDGFERTVSEDELERTISDAERVVACARKAATFLADGRLPDLDRAIATAQRRGAEELERRGRKASATLRRLDDALGGTGDSTVEGSGSRDHFRSARGTVLGGRDEEASR